MRGTVGRGGKKKSEDKGGADAAKEDKAGVAAGAAGAKPAPAKSPKKAAAEVTKDSKDDKLQVSTAWRLARSRLRRARVWGQARARCRPPCPGALEPARPPTSRCGCRDARRFG